MNIYFIRHSDAENSSITTKDFERKLTEGGIEKIRKSAEGWKHVISSFDYVVSSPLLRSLQTAEQILDVYNLDKSKLIIDKRLKSGSDLDDIIEIANSLNEDEIAFVGHQPEFSEHVSELISQTYAYIDFKKAAIAKINFYNKVKKGKGLLEFLIPPQIFK
jgi:phosphohistidine phosphatase